MSAVFLSASIPDPRRNPKYFESSDNVAIRDAVTALVELVLPVGHLYFGGHPAITPLVRRTAERLGRIEAVRNYQSLWFERFFPPENAAFKHLIFVPREETQEESVKAMRIAMLHEEPFMAAFFIGGMEGVEAEFEMLRGLSPVPACFPVGSTGGASLILLREYRGLLGLEQSEIESLLKNSDYVSLLRQLLRRSGFLPNRTPSS